MTLLITESPDNTRRERNRDSYAHDVFSEDDTKKIEEAVKVILARGRNAV